MHGQRFAPGEAQGRRVERRREASAKHKREPRQKKENKRRETSQVRCLACGLGSTLASRIAVTQEYTGSRKSDAKVPDSKSTAGERARRARESSQAGRRESHKRKRRKTNKDTQKARRERERERRVLGECPAGLGGSCVSPLKVPRRPFAGGEKGTGHLPERSSLDDCLLLDCERARGSMLPRRLDTARSGSDAGRIEGERGSWRRQQRHHGPPAWFTPHPIPSGPPPPS